MYNLFFGTFVFNGVKFLLWDRPNEEKQDATSAATVTRLINPNDGLTELKAMGPANMTKLEEKLG